MLIEIKSWHGKLGNNLEQIAYGFWLARKTKGQLICNLNHSILVPPRSIIFGNNLNPKIYGSISFDELEAKKIDLEHERFYYLPNILQEIGPRVLQKITPKQFNGLVVHVRAGNIFRDTSLSKTMNQAPLKFFDKVYQTVDLPKNILIITGGNIKKYKLQHNPITNHIIKYCNENNMSYTLHIGPVEEAAGFLLGAKQAMITGYTTFSRMLLLANKHLEQVIIPVMRYSAHDEKSFKSHSCHVEYFDILDYSKEWNEFGPKMQHQHSIDKIVKR